MNMFDKMDGVIKKFNCATDKLKRCKGKNRNAKRGVGHSEECLNEHNDIVNKTSVKEVPPSCFDRAENAGRSFDNCRFYNDCKNVKPICVNYPLCQSS